jgi:hypothetical protein
MRLLLLNMEKPTEHNMKPSQKATEGEYETQTLMTMKCFHGKREVLAPVSTIHDAVEVFPLSRESKRTWQFLGVTEFD